MTKRATPKKPAVEADSVYFLKVVLYFVLGLIWIKHDGLFIVPIGLILGVIFTRHDHFAIDRKVEYAILVISALCGLATGYAVSIVI